MKTNELQGRVRITLTPDGAIALKGHLVGRYGSDRALGTANSLLNSKRAIQAAPPRTTFIAALPEWEGPLFERAAVALGMRKKSSKHIASVVPVHP